MLIVLSFYTSDFFQVKKIHIQGTKDEKPKETNRLKVFRTFILLTF